MTNHTPGRSSRIELRLATAEDRRKIYRIRHEIYGREIAQHSVRSDGVLSDAIDEVNDYVVAISGDVMAGFVSITPPNALGYSVDKYVERDRIPVPFDSGLFEVRLLSVTRQWRASGVASALMYAAYRILMSRGAAHVVVMGRVGATTGLYERVGFRHTGLRVASGAVEYDIMVASMSDISAADRALAYVGRRVEGCTLWNLPVPIRTQDLCYHGGASITMVGDEFDAIDRAASIVSADVLDAWFPPAPAVRAALQKDMEYLLRTSPPTDCGGMLRIVSNARQIPYDSLVPGAGSSDLIFRCFSRWLTPRTSVLILDPTYGEYPFAAEQLGGCRVDRFHLSADDGFRVDLDALAARMSGGYDLVVLVNPNSPTGQAIPGSDLRRLVAGAPPSTLVWLDETYIDYLGADHSLEQMAAEVDNLVVCKSMSKVYALSGARVAYLSTSASRAAAIRTFTPPWVVSHLAQLAAIRALQSREYYENRYAETRALRHDLVRAIEALPGVGSVLESVANFVLVRLEPEAPSARTVCDACRAEGVFLREMGNMTARIMPSMLRIAVKDADANRRVVQALRRALVHRNRELPPEAPDLAEVA